MLYIKQKIHLKKQKIALDKTIKNLLGDLVKSESYYFDNSLQIKIDNLQIKFGSLILPSWEELSKEAKKIYKNFDHKVVKKIMYNFVDVPYNPTEFIISAKNSDLGFYSGYLYDIKIVDADNVLVYNMKNGGTKKIDFNVKDTIVIHHSIFDMIKSSTKLNSKRIECISSQFDSPSSDIYINTNEINLYNTHIEASKISIIADECITGPITMLKASELINIRDKNCDNFDRISSPKIIYNGVAITDKKDVERLKLNKKLIELLKNMKSNIENEKINNEENTYNKSISKILKK